MIPHTNIRHLLATSLILCSCLRANQSRLIAQATNHPALSQVQFVGCESDGQVGPLKAPKGKPRTLPIPTGIAERLAYYQAEEGFGILAPRGWHCFSTYGSNGSNLYVTPEPLNSPTLFSQGWMGLSGQAIQVSLSVGDTSGRFTVAKVMARLFPDQKEFVGNVIKEGIEPVSSFPTGPYPTDKLKYRSKSVVEFETPPNSKGLGTDSMLQTNSSPIRGVAILFGREPSLAQAFLRLAAEDQGLIQTIIRQLERETAAPGGK